MADRRRGAGAGAAERSGDAAQRAGGSDRQAGGGRCRVGGVLWRERAGAAVGAVGGGGTRSERGGAGGLRRRRGGGDVTSGWAWDGGRHHGSGDGAGAPAAGVWDGDDVGGG